MRRWIGGVAAAAAALTAASALGVAGAQPPATSAPAGEQRLITANGTADIRMPSDASASDRRTAYRTALAAALDDAGAKAAFIAQHTGLTLGAVQSVTEQTGSIFDGCLALGEFATIVPGGLPLPVPQVPRPHRKPAKHKAKATRPQAETVQCEVPAGVTVAYAVSGP
jgi:hypothetical protein